LADESLLEPELARDLGDADRRGKGTRCEPLRRPARIAESLALLAIELEYMNLGPILEWPGRERTPRDEQAANYGYDAT